MKEAKAVAAGMLKLFDGVICKYGDSYYIRVPKAYVKDKHLQLNTKIPIYKP